MTAQVPIFTTSEVASLAYVDGSTVRQWVKAGKISPIRTTVGGHYRFSEDEVRRALGIDADVPLREAVAS